MKYLVSWSGGFSQKVKSKSEAIEVMRDLINDYDTVTISKLWQPPQKNAAARNQVRSMRDGLERRVSKADVKDTDSVDKRRQELTAALAKER